jgi:hypothetical protein
MASAHASGRHSPPSSLEPFLVRFYDENTLARDSRRRNLPDILRFNDDELEYHHDYIQILFPLPEGSPFNPSAPIIDRATFNAFRSRKDLRNQVRTSFTRMLSFYGFAIDSDDGVVTPAKNWNKASKGWVKRFSHNHLRLTRIIRSLRVLGLEVEAQLFFQALVEVYEKTGKISETSLRFWTRATERPLYLAPEDEEDTGTGIGFLYEFEASKSNAEQKSLEHNDDNEKEWEGIKDDDQPAAVDDQPTNDHDANIEVESEQNNVKE